MRLFVLLRAPHTPHIDTYYYCCCCYYKEWYNLKLTLWWPALMPPSFVVLCLHFILLPLCHYNHFPTHFRSSCTFSPSSYAWSWNKLLQPWYAIATTFTWTKTKPIICVNFPFPSLITTNTNENSSVFYDENKPDKHYYKPAALYIMNSCDAEENYIFFLLVPQIHSTWCCTLSAYWWEILASFFTIPSNLQFLTRTHNLTVRVRVREKKGPILWIQIQFC